MDQDQIGTPLQSHLNTHLAEISQLLSHLHGEVTTLEESYSQVLQVLRKIEGAANIDDLTGLLRRRAFFNQWEALLDECQRLNEESGVLMIDIDHFKRINDTYGHATGDEVIRNVASLLKQFESPECIVSRVGGEEFAVAIKGSEAEVNGIAELIRKGAERLRGDSAEWTCTLSIGVTMDGAHDCKHENASATSTMTSPKAELSSHFLTAERDGNELLRHQSESGLTPQTEKNLTPVSRPLSQKPSSPPSLGSAKTSEMLSAADEALYEAKKNGRNQVRKSKRTSSLLPNAA